MDKETQQRALYKELRAMFNRLDLRLVTMGKVGAQVTYVPDDITVRAVNHPTLLENRIQCLIDITVALGLREATKTGERLTN